MDKKDRDFIIKIAKTQKVQADLAVQTSKAVRELQEKFEKIPKCSCPLLKNANLGAEINKILNDLNPKETIGTPIYRVPIKKMPLTAHIKTVQGEIQIIFGPTFPDHWKKPLSEALVDAIKTIKEVYGKEK